MFDVLDTKIIQLLAADLTTAEIAERIFCSIATIKNRIGKIKAKLRCKTRAGLVYKLINKKILIPPNVQAERCPLKRYGSGLNSLL
jgi:DNA-binding CsgD family transcriptional regulator